MVKTHSVSTVSNNPLFDKMCDRFQFAGGVSVAEVMLKKAERHPVRKIHVVQSKPERRTRTFTLTPVFVRHASICCSILVLVSVLMLCAIFGTSANGEFSKKTGVFAGASQSEATPAEGERENLIVYSHDGAEIAVITSSGTKLSSHESETVQN